MKSNEKITRMIELAEIYAHEMEIVGDTTGRDYYEEVARILNWVLNDGTESLFD